MKVFALTLQKPHTGRHKPNSQCMTVIVTADSEAEAKHFAFYHPRTLHFPVIRVEEIPIGQLWIVRA